jgi:predicted aminopeptidase
MQVPNGGIKTALLETSTTTSNGVTTAKIADSAITTAKIANSTSTTTGVTTAKIANSAVTTDKIANNGVTQSKLANNVVGNGPAFKAYANTTTSIPDNDFAKVTFDVEVFDTNSNYNATTSRFTPKIAGYYLITGCVSYLNLVDGALVRINKNNTPYAMGAPQGLSTYRSNVSDIVYLDGVDDFVELFAYQDSGTQNLQTGLHVTYFSGCLIRSA